LRRAGLAGVAMWSQKRVLILLICCTILQLVQSLEAEPKNAQEQPTVEEIEAEINQSWVMRGLGWTGLLDPKSNIAQSLVPSFALILVSELGDKTFIIAAIMAMKHSRLEIFSAALGALALMTVLSAVIGSAAPKLLPVVWTHWGAAILFLFFGLKLLKDAYEMEPGGDGPSEEMVEVESELRKTEEEEGSSSDDEIAKHGRKNSKHQGHSLREKLFPRVWIQCFTLTFVAEWGDRSQISTMVLAAQKSDSIGVTIGGILGHSICTGLAVVGGRLLAARISERTVTIAGGILFIIFFAMSVWEGPPSDFSK